MSAIALDKLVARNQDLISAAIEIQKNINGAFSILDMEGNTLINTGGLPKVDVSEVYPIKCCNQQLGSVTGGEIACLLAGILSRAADFEIAKIALSKEVLNRYRELNLLYNLSEKLASSLQPNELAKIALEEAKRILSASSGAVLGNLPGAENQRRLATFGDRSHLDDCLVSSMDLRNTVTKTGRAQVINNFSLENMSSCAEGAVFSIMCAPIGIKSQSNPEILGTIFLASQPEAVFSAGDLELLNTVATQAAPVLELAFRHERELEEARKREEAIYRHIEEFLGEIDPRIDIQVTQITEAEYFIKLQKKIDTLRNIIQTQ